MQVDAKSKATIVVMQVDAKSKATIVVIHKLLQKNTVRSYAFQTSPRFVGASQPHSKQEKIGILK